jgi:hypothetical protein
MSDRPLCRMCHGNGVIKFRGGLSQCYRCGGECWEPILPSPRRPKGDDSDGADSELRQRMAERFGREAVQFTLFLPPVNPGKLGS